MNPSAENQEKVSPAVTKSNDNSLQIVASFQDGLTILNTFLVFLSLDADQHLRIYRRASKDFVSPTVSDELFMDLTAADVTRIDLSQTKLMIKTGGKRYRIDLSGYDANLAQLSAGGVGGAPGSNARILFAVLRIKDAIARTPIDTWFATLKQYNFPIKSSKLNEFVTKVALQHLVATIVIGMIVLLTILVFAVTITKQ